MIFLVWVSPERRRGPLVDAKGKESGVTMSKSTSIPLTSRHNNRSRKRGCGVPDRSWGDSAHKYHTELIIMSKSNAETLIGCDSSGNQIIDRIFIHLIHDP